VNAQREPALFAGVVGAAVALAMAYGIVNEVQGAAWAAFLIALIPLATAWWTRHRVMPVDTIRDAGFNPERVKDRAEDPAVPRNTEGEG
jgi:hypothetical protein